jgi:peroxiredoxin
MRTTLTTWFVFMVLLLVGNTELLAQQTTPFVWAPDFPVGSKIPMLEAQDQTGTVQTLASLTGKKGLILQFSRSLDWCPYCKAQFKQLIPVAPTIEALGFNIALMTYDSVEKLRDIALDDDIKFKLLHDEAVTHVTAFGILNTSYKPGHSAYGVPQPGIMILSPDGTILQKIAEEDFRVRPDYSVVLDALKKLDH